MDVSLRGGSSLKSSGKGASKRGGRSATKGGLTSGQKKQATLLSFFGRGGRSGGKDSNPVTQKVEVVG